MHKCCNWENKSFCRPRSLSQINALTTLLYLGQKNQTRKWLFLSKLQTVFVQIVKCICHPFVNALPTLPYLETLNHWINESLQCGINVNISTTSYILKVNYSQRFKLIAPHRLIWETFEKTINWFFHEKKLYLIFHHPSSVVTSPPFTLYIINSCNFHQNFKYWSCQTIWEKNNSTVS